MEWVAQGFWDFAYRSCMRVGRLHNETVRIGFSMESDGYFVLYSK
jgi:hypothetical protein